MKATLCDTKNCGKLVETDDSEYAFDAPEALLTVTIKDRDKDLCEKCRKRIFYLAVRGAFDDLKTKREPKVVTKKTTKGETQWNRHLEVK